MLFIEFPIELTHGNTNIVKYRNINDNSWYYMYMDVETLNLLVQNYGIVGTKRMPTGFTNADNGTTSNVIKLSYSGAAIEFHCHESRLYVEALTHIEQAY